MKQPKARPIEDLARVLREVETKTDMQARLLRDPVCLLHTLSSPGEQELYGLAISGLAFGNAGVVVRKGRELLDRIGSVETVDDPKALKRALATFRHRLYTGEDLSLLLLGARKLQRTAPLGEHFAREFHATGSLREALVRFVGAVRSGHLDTRATRGADHLLPDPAGTSASKRLCLYLRWMVRPADGVDLGIWKGIPPSALLVPMDVHLSRLARNVGLTDRQGATFAAAEEVTAKLRLVDANDPVRFDFPLCHLGMVQGCPSKRDIVRCDGCGVRPICRHWVPKARVRA